MNDLEIIELYFERDETAIKETDAKYGKLCHSIAYNILNNNEDSEECVNDTWLGAWNAMPPQRPNMLRMFLAKITRNLSFNRYESQKAEKRGGGEIHIVLDELAECIANESDTENEYIAKELEESIAMLGGDETERSRRIELLRYQIDEIQAADIQEGEEELLLSKRNKIANLEKIITALQEAGNKLSRDMISATYNAFSSICTLSIELIRQFYSVPRSVRILGEDGGFSYSLYDNSVLRGGVTEGDFGLEGALRQPLFDVKVKAHRQNVFSRAAQNADALNFYSMGFFDPEKAVQSLACMELLDIENKNKIRAILLKNHMEITQNSPSLPHRNIKGLFPENNN